MGEHARGEIASKIARESIVGEIIDGRNLSHAIAIGNREICLQGAKQNCSRSMGSTVVALHISGADFELAWVGDSRCYLAMGTELKQLSSDHSFMQELIDAGVMSPAQAKTSRYRNVVTQALGITAPEQLRIDSVRGTLRPGMQILLCSDGLTEELSDTEIARILRCNSVAGATANDVNDVDDGGNRLQNFPEFAVPIAFLPSGGLSTSVQYRVDSALANASYPITVHFYRGACGGGSEKLMQTDVYTAAQAQSLKTITLNSPDGGNMLPLVASAIDAAGNNSEFSPMIGDAIMRSDFEDVLAPLTPGKCLPPN